MNKIYIMNITPLLDVSVFEKNISRVDQIRMQKIQKLLLPSTKAQSLGVGLLLRYAIESNTNLEYDSLRFFTEETGKPHVESDVFYFSLSHSGDYAVCAISDTPVGVDVERDKELSKKMKERFAESVLEWTKKEARGKMTGIGVFDTSEGNFEYSHYKTNDGYIITVCSDKKAESFVLCDNYLIM